MIRKQNVLLEKKYHSTVKNVYVFFVEIFSFFLFLTIRKKKQFPIFELC